MHYIAGKMLARPLRSDGEGVLALTLSFTVELRCPPQEKPLRVNMWLTRNVSKQSEYFALNPADERTGISITQVTIKTLFELVSVDSRNTRAVSTVTTSGPDYLPEVLESRIGLEYDVSHVGVSYGQRTRDYATALKMVGEANLNMDALVSLSNEHGELCYNQAGGFMLPLKRIFGPGAKSEVAALLQYPQFTGSICEPRRLEPNADHYAARGEVRFNTSKCAIFYNGQPASTFVSRWSERPRETSPLEHVIAAREAQSGPRGIRSTWSSLSGIGIYCYNNRTSSLPALAFADHPLGGSSEKYYKHCAKLAYARMGFTEAEALSWDLTNRTHCRRLSYWLATLFSIYVQYCDYIGDALWMWNRKRKQWEYVPVEYFYFVRLRFGSLDCEDGSMEFLIHADELRRLRSTDPTILLAQAVLRNFRVVMMLDGVSGAKINLDSSDAHLNAHMNASLVNLQLFNTWTQNYAGNKGSDAMKSTPAQLASAKNFPPIVVMESTGPLDPNGEEEAEGDRVGEEMMAASLRRFPVLAGQWRPIFHYSARAQKPGEAPVENGFFKTVKTMITQEDLAAGGGLGIWTLATYGPDGRGTELTAGVKFGDIASASTKIVAIEQPALTEQERDIMRSYQLDNPPMPILQTAEEAGFVPDIVKTAESQMEEFMRVVKSVASTHRRDGGHIGKRLIKYGFFEPTRTNLTAAIAWARASPIAGIKVLPEDPTVDRGGFLIEVHWA